MTTNTLQRQNSKKKGKFQAIPTRQATDPVANAIAENIEILTGQRGHGGKKAVLWEDLEELKLASMSSNGKIRSLLSSTGGGDTDSGKGKDTGTTQPKPKIEPPTQPTNARIHNGFGLTTLTWDTPTYKGHSYTEIFQAQTDDFTKATLIDSTSANIRTIPLSLTGDYYFWIRFVNLKGAIGPIHNTAGLHGKSVTDPQYFLDLIAQRINKDPDSFYKTVKLEKFVRNAIDLSKFPDIETVEALDKIIAEGVIENAITEDIQTSERRHDHLSLKATIETKYYTIVDSNKAIAAAIQTLKSKIEDPNGNSIAAILKTNYQTKATTKAALTGVRQYLESKISGVNANLTNNYKTWSDTQNALSQLETNFNTTIKGVEKTINDIAKKGLSKTISDLKSDIKKNYVTKTDQTKAISQVTQDLESTVNTVKQSVADNKKSVTDVAANLSNNYMTKTEINKSISQSSQSLTSSIRNLPTRWKKDIGAAKADLKKSIDAAKQESTLIRAKLNNDYLTKAQTNTAISQAEQKLTTDLKGVKSSVSTLSQSVSGVKSVKALWQVKASVNDLRASIGLVAKSSSQRGVNEAFFTVNNAQFQVIYDSAGKKQRVPVFGTITNPEWTKWSKTRKGREPVRYVLAINTASIKVAQIKDLVAGDIVADSIVAQSTINSPILKAPVINDANSNFYVNQAGHAHMKKIRIESATSGSRMVLTEDRLEVYDGSSLRVRIGKL